jgi:aryl-alcohol dehydrogenase-like predicted oxidoreductase
MGTWQTFDTAEDRGPIVAEALAAGIDLFDSSPMYGRAETTLAKALGRAARRGHGRHQDLDGQRGRRS